MNFNQSLCDFAAEVQGQPYVRPDTVCLALAFRALDAATSTDFYAQCRPHIRSAASMRRYLDNAGLDGLIVKLLDSGFTEVDLQAMQPGDIGFTGGAPFGIGAVVMVGSKLLTSNPDDGVLLCSADLVVLQRVVRFNRFVNVGVS
ncbi:hypothetical protein R6242_14370 [Iodobacter sp. CM08]|uniref:DUF6950 family protein n=1 Tax=Iodobacter sp. CM08 TaxID=3085902 RepID=UPI00298235C7|nr:hypothetical protein [Iodobacter sp. CM08]MDW5417752.1 hypothetical protein [Iodobacter sp. CM08]